VIEKRSGMTRVTTFLVLSLALHANAQSPRDSRQAAEAGTFRAGQQIVIDVDGQYYLGSVERVAREDGCTRVDYRWTAGNRYGSGYTYPDCTQFATIYSLADARRNEFVIVNASPAPSLPPPATSRPGPAPTPPNTAAAPAQIGPAQIQELLRAHNRWRAEVGVPGLTWSSAVAASAQAWADKLAAIGDLRHDATNYGENLYMGSGPRTPTEAVDNWGSEKAECNYRGEAIGNQTCVVGHYTQVVWRGSRELGCGVARTADGSHVWVCRYNPPGNFTGQRPY
jgi:pathogenesis-related protein 1